LTGGTWLTYTVNDFFLSGLKTGPLVLPFGQLVKTSTSPQIYLADDTDTLIPVNSFAIPASFGIPTSFLTLAPSDLAGLTVTVRAMTNIVTCAYGLGAYLGGASDGVSGPFFLDPKIAVAFPSTPVSDALCGMLEPGSRPSINADVKISGDPAVYRLTTSGTKRHVLSGSQLAPGMPVPTVDTGMLNAVPRGTDVVSAGMLIKRASAPMVYIYDGAGGAIPVSSFATTADLGLGTSFFVVTDATLDALTPGSRPMTNAYVCKTSQLPLIGAQGKRRTIDAMGDIPHLVVPDPLCSVLYATYGAGPVLLRSAHSPAVYELLGGQKHWILTGAALSRITGGNPDPLILQPNDAFLTSIPVGAPIS
jgi:hypothetical protein